MLKRFFISVFTLLLMGLLLNPTSAWADTTDDGRRADPDWVQKDKDDAWQRDPRLQRKPQEVKQNGVTSATIWEERDIWVSDGVQDPRWPVEEALALWNTNGVVKFHYTTMPCSEVKGTCIPVELGPRQDDRTIAFATLYSSHPVFVSAKVTLIVDRGQGLNTCTLLHEFGHVIADIPHGWWIEGGEAPSVMNGACDQQLAEGRPLTLPLVDKWYVEEAYRINSDLLATRNRQDKEVKMREVKQSAEIAQQWAEQATKADYEVFLLSLMIASSITIGVCSTLIVQRLAAAKRQ